MASETDPSNILADLVATPVVDAARIVEEKGGKLLIELQYSVKDYKGEEASKYQYEQTVLLDTAASTVEFTAVSSLIDPDFCKFKSISPSGAHALVGIRKKTTEEGPSNYLQV